MSEMDYCVAGPNDLDAIVQFVLTNHITDETIGQAVGLKPQSVSVQQFYTDLTRACLGQAVSFLARETGSGRIVGVRLAEIILADNYDQKLQTFFAYNFPDSSLMILIEFMKYVFNRLDPDFTLSKSRKVLMFNLVCVEKNRRRQGIARHLTKLSLDAGKAKRCDTVLVMSTGFQAQSLYRQLNFSAVLEAAYSEFHGEYKQQPIVPKNGSGLCQVLIRPI